MDEGPGVMEAAGEGPPFPVPFLSSSPPPESTIQSTSTTTSASKDSPTALRRQ
ncbi:hypothetical protein [Streptomyces sp. NBC_00237]|uniref:hypothetical protein n=1 Tax=Streptomyces sp. NBC_00237 TaxID=2975687 RepID=UPI002B1D8AAE|nr:hypothetical protein [Streptomyces sp. NBC_00237]